MLQRTPEEKTQWEEKKNLERLWAINNEPAHT